MHAKLQCNLVIDELLIKQDHEGYKTLAYTNDLVILTQSNLDNVVRDKTQKALQSVKK